MDPKAKCVLLRGLPQRTTNDCGLVAVAAVLSRGFPAQEPNVILTSVSNRARQLFGEASDVRCMWTVELALLLTEISPPCTMKLQFFTQVVGVNKDHKQLEFYSSVDAEEEEAVNACFAALQHRCVPVEEKVLPMDYIVNMVEAGRDIFIVLVNKLLLRHSGVLHCLGRCASYCRRGVLPYVGHFVVVVGCSRREGTVYIWDPDHKHDGASPIVPMSTADFDAARRSRGTDCDTIQITLCV